MLGTPCWDHLNCTAKGDCPAYPDKGYECWSVEGTLCRGEKQPDYHRKVGACRTQCSYYNGVMSGAIRVT
jgi:methyl-accepting chemotaxis protein